MPDIYIIDKHTHISDVCHSLKQEYLRFDNATEAMNTLENVTEAVVLLNYAVKTDETAEFIEVLTQNNSTLKIIVIGRDLPDNDVILCFLAGAIGFQDNHTLDRYISKLVSVVQAGEAWISRRLVASMLTYWREQTPA